MAHSQAGRFLWLIVLLQPYNLLQANDVISKVVPIGSKYQNSIRLLNNRFRIDSDVEEVTLVFFREFGSPPIVLVRPNGSKLFLENDLKDESFTWFETESYDMIALKKPMPGPWQAVGQILPESRVMIIAGITLNAKPIPDTVFSGETIKQTAFLENAGSKVDMTQFRDVVALSIEFMSANNPSYPNFGLGSKAIARFEDNGLGLDEKDGDGVFTGQFNLAITEGEWQPIFTVRTPLFSREQVNEKIVLLPNPVLLSHELETTLDKDHLLTIDVDRTHIEIGSVLLDGTVKQPNGESLRFSVTEPSLDPKEVTLMNTDYGVYKVNMTVFATTTTGREIVLNVPEYSFVTEAPPIIEVLEEPEVPTITELDVLEADLSVEEEDIPILLILGINLGLLIFGGVALFLIVDKRNNPNNHALLRLKTKLQSITFKKPKAEPEKT